MCSLDYAGDQDVQRLVEQALILQASGSWRKLENLRDQAKSIDQPLARRLIRALCVNPLQALEKDLESVNALAVVAPRPAIALALGRNLLALAQEQIITAQRASAENTLRQALACSVEATAIAGLLIPEYLPDQMFSQAFVLMQTLASQLDLELARQREQLPAQLVLVLGMHRSGTSALSGLLVESGLDGPADLMPASPANPKGYYESLGAMRLNDRLLADLKSSWCNTAAIPESRWVSSAPAVDAWRSGLLELLQNAYPRGGRAVLKDPRLCILMPGLRPWLESSLISFVAFLPVRHPSEVIESLWVAESIPRSQGLILWIRHVLEAERHSRVIERLIVPYERLIADPNAILCNCFEALAKSAGSDGLRPLEMMAPAKFIDPRLHRQRAASAVPEWALEERADAFYTFALSIYSLLAENELPERYLQAEMDRLWVQWTTLLAHSQTLLSGE